MQVQLELPALHQKPNLSLYSPYHAEAGNEFAVPISTSLLQGNTATCSGVEPLANLCKIWPPLGFELSTSVCFKILKFVYKLHFTVISNSLITYAMSYDTNSLITYAISYINPLITYKLVNYLRHVVSNSLIIYAMSYVTR